jgi:hypothetical protein
MPAILIQLHKRSLIVSLPLHYPISGTNFQANYFLPDQRRTFPLHIIIITLPFPTWKTKKTELTAPNPKCAHVLNPQPAITQPPQKYYPAPVEESRFWLMFLFPS